MVCLMFSTRFGNIETSRRFGNKDIAIHQPSSLCVGSKKPRLLGVLSSLCCGSSVAVSVCQTIKRVHQAIVWKKCIMRVWRRLRWRTPRTTQMAIAESLGLERLLGLGEAGGTSACGVVTSLSARDKAIASTST